MDSALLATKLFIPPLGSGLVTRPRLLEKLQGALNNNLTLISAAAGFGKTTLLSDWTHHVQLDVGITWFSVDASDNDPIRFWDYFMAALKVVHPEIGETAKALLHSSQALPIESTLTALINDMAALTRDIVLVMDDYHYIDSQPISSGITFMLEHLPPPVHLVIATRVDPPLPLVRFRGKGILLEIGANDLVFSGRSYCFA